MRVLLAFLRRDWKIAASYKLTFVLMIVGGLVTLAAFFFLSRTLGVSPVLKRFRSDYFSFALIGVAVAAALRTVQTSFAQRLREAQTDGSLEVLLSTPLSTFRVVTMMAAWPILQSLVRALGLLFFGWWIFGARLHLSVPAFTLILLLSLTAFGALGLMSAAFVLTFKRGDPFSYALDVATYLLSGVIYPVEVLPRALQYVARILPATWSLQGLREAGLNGAPLSQVWGTAAVLAGFCAVLWPLASLLLWAARRHAERAGTLAHS